MSRFRFLLALLVAINAPGAEPALEFVHLSDTHLTNFGAIHPALSAALQVKKNANANLHDALRRLGTGSSPAFAIVTGDLIDGYSFDGPTGKRVLGQIDVFRDAAARSPVPVYPVLGNHDLTHYRYEAGNPRPVTDQSVAAQARKAWGLAVPLFRERTYYAFRKQVGRRSYLFLALDNGEAKGRDAAYAAAQLAWVKSQLTGHPADTVILAMHIPMPAAPFAPELQGILAGSPNVALILAGHRHTDGIEEIETGARRVTQVRTAAMFLSGANARLYRLREDRIEVTATGQPDQVVAAIRLAAAAGASASDRPPAVGSSARRNAARR
jgi:hypothetical protein